MLTKGSFSMGVRAEKRPEPHPAIAERFAKGEPGSPMARDVGLIISPNPSQCLPYQEWSHVNMTDVFRGLRLSCSPNPKCWSEDVGMTPNLWL